MSGGRVVVGVLVLAFAMALAVGADAARVATSEALVAAVAAGGVVWVEPGDYVLPETLVIAHDVELRSVEPLAATLLLQGSPAGLRVEGGAHARLAGLRLASDGGAPGDVVRVHDARATFEEVAIGLAVAAADADDAAAGATDALGRGLLLTGEAHVEVIGGGLGRHEGAAAEVRDGARLYVEGALLAGNGAGVVASGEARVELWEAELRDHPGGAFELAGAARVRLADVTVEATGTWAHTYAVGQVSLQVEGGTFAGNEGAVYAGQGARVVLDGVVLTGGAAEGVVVEDHAFVTVLGGRIEDHAGFGVAAYGEARVHVAGAQVVRNRSGLVAMGAATLLVRDAEVADHERTGIAFLDASTGEAAGNRVRGNGWTGVVVAGEAVASVLGNLLEANGERGAWFDEAGGGRFEANTVRASPVGVEVAADAGPTLGPNAFEDVATEVLGAD